jgi:hypothetical protein
MTDNDSITPARAGRYQEMAIRLHALVSLMKTSEARDQLSVLAVEYERLAQCVKTVSESLQTPTAPGSGDSSLRD